MKFREIVRSLTPEPLRMLKRRAFRASDGDIALREHYLRIHGRAYDEANITTFADKLFRFMIETNRNADASLTQFVDKLAVRDFVAATIGERHLTLLIWSGANPAHIPFDELPSRCIIKTNHGCGGHILFDASSNRENIIASLRAALSQNYYWSMREYQYYGIKPQILIEQLLADGFKDGPLDFRFWCFHGIPAMVQVDNNAHSINPFYDLDWNKLPLHYRCDGAGEVPKPKNFQEMVSIAGRLSKDFDFVRVDLYNIQGHTVFGEMTFTPVAGSLRLEPAEWDRKLGERWG
jgi:hypothetical protein